MEIPYYIFLIIYAVGIIALMAGFWIHFYHIKKFGWFDFTAKLNTILFLAVVVVVLGITALLLKDIPWTESFEIFKTGTGISI